MNKSLLQSYDVNDQKSRELLLKKLQSSIETEESFREVLQLDPLMLEHIYSIAYNYFKVGDFAQAKEVFKLLMGLDSKDAKYVMGCAACMHHLKEWEDAAVIYSLAQLLDESNPLPTYFAAECFYEMGQLTQADTLFKAFYLLAKEKNELKTYCGRALEVINNNDKNRGKI